MITARIEMTTEPAAVQVVTEKTLAQEPAIQGEEITAAAIPVSVTTVVDNRVAGVITEAEEAIIEITITTGILKKDTDSIINRLDCFKQNNQLVVTLII